MQGWRGFLCIFAFGGGVLAVDIVADGILPLKTADGQTFGQRLLSLYFSEKDTLPGSTSAKQQFYLFDHPQQQVLTRMTLKITPPGATYFQSPSTRSAAVVDDDDDAKYWLPPPDTYWVFEEMHPIPIVTIRIYKDDRVPTLEDGSPDEDCNLLQPEIRVGMGIHSFDYAAYPNQKINVSVLEMIPARDRLAPYFELLEDADSDAAHEEMSVSRIAMMIEPVYRGGSGLILTHFFNVTAIKQGMHVGYHTRFEARKFDVHVQLSIPTGVPVT